jgi:chemotaxis response regulator CheB
LNESIDVFLKSMAEDAGKSAIAVILSGGDKDGLKVASKSMLKEVKS